MIEGQDNHWTDHQERWEIWCFSSYSWWPQCLNKSLDIIFRQVFLFGAWWRRKNACVSFWHDRNGAGKRWIITRNTSLNAFLEVQGECPTYYKEGPKSIGTEWPPRFVKVVSILLPISLRLNFCNPTVHFASHRWCNRINSKVSFQWCSTTWAYTTLCIAFEWTSNFWARFRSHSVDANS